MNLFHDAMAPRTSANIASLLQQRPMTPATSQEADRLEEIGAQAARIAHDLNNLLSPILLSLEAFRPHLEEAAHQMMLDIARKSTLRAKDLVKQITSFASGAEEVSSEIDPRGLVEEIASFVGATFPSSVDVDLNIAEDLAPISANGSQLHRALLNLCINARDAMPEGGTLGLRASNVTFEHAEDGAPRSARNSRYVLFEISDTGSGIPESIRERIFDPFFTTKGPGKGTGLGLASVRSIVEKYAGLLSLQTELGQGTTFYVLIPASESSQPAKGSDLRIVAA